MLLSTKNLNLKIAARKLLCKFVGPFEVLAPPEHATNPNVLWLKTPRQFKIHMPVNVKDIKRYHRRDDDVGGPPEQMPEPIVIDGEDCYEVEAVLAAYARANAPTPGAGQVDGAGLVVSDVGANGEYSPMGA